MRRSLPLLALLLLNVGPDLPASARPRADLVSAGGASRTDEDPNREGQELHRKQAEAVLLDPKSGGEPFHQAAETLARLPGGEHSLFKGAQFHFDRDAERCWICLNALHARGRKDPSLLPDGLVPLLVRVLSTSPHDIERKGAAEILGQMGGRARAALPTLRKVRAGRKGEAPRAAGLAIRKIEPSRER